MNAQVRRLLLTGRIVNVIEHPAAVEFVFADGSVVKMYDGDRDYDRRWEVTR